MPTSIIYSFILQNTNNSRRGEASAERPLSINSRSCGCFAPCYHPCLPWLNLPRPLILDSGPTLSRGHALRQNDGLMNLHRANELCWMCGVLASPPQCCQSLVRAQQVESWTYMTISLRPYRYWSIFPCLPWLRSQHGSTSVRSSQGRR
jgi:hypothetical protein